MVRLFEYQGKEILKKEGISVPEGGVVSKKEEVNEIAQKLNSAIVLKAQIFATGRMKTGAIKFVENPEKAEKAAEELLGRTIKGFKVEKILVEKKIPVDSEFYLSVIVNDSCSVKGPEIIFSTEGGIDIEQVAERSPEKVGRFVVSYLKGFDTVKFKQFLESMDLEQKLIENMTNFAERVYRVFVEYDARIVEINPVILSGNELYAADCKITVDDSSVFRHPEFHFDVPRDMERPATELEKIAWKIEEGDYRGTAYFVQLTLEEPNDKEKGKGYVAFHGIGGGASMLAADALLKSGLKIANYADSSGNPPASKIYRLIRVILSQPGIEGYVIMGSVFASQEQWHHAHAIVKAFRENQNALQGFPVVILLAGNREKESHEILREEFEKMSYRYEVFGREYIYKPEYIANRVIELVEEYRKEKGS